MPFNEVAYRGRGSVSATGEGAGQGDLRTLQHTLRICYKRGRKPFAEVWVMSAPWQFDAMLAKLVSGPLAEAAGTPLLMAVRGGRYEVAGVLIRLKAAFSSSPVPLHFVLLRWTTWAKNTRARLNGRQFLPIRDIFVTANLKLGILSE